MCSAGVQHWVSCEKPGSFHVERPRGSDYDGRGSATQEGVLASVEADLEVM